MKRAAVILLSFSFCLISACQPAYKETETGEQNPAASEKTKEPEQEIHLNDLENGMEIASKLGNRIELRGTVRIPENGLEQVKIYHVKETFFNGSEVLKQLAPTVEEAACQSMDYQDIGVSSALLYSGELSVGEEKTEGSFSFGTTVNYYTQDWINNSYHFPEAENVNRKFLNQELENFSLSQSVGEAEAVLARILNSEKEQLNAVYGYSHTYLQEQENQSNQMKETESAGGKPGEREAQIYTEDRDCYLIRFDPLFNGIPVVSPLDSGDTNDLYKLSVKREVGVTRRGIEYVSAMGNLEEEGEEKAVLVDLPELFQSLEKKFELVSGSQGTVTSMRLIYSVYVTDGNKFRYDLIPVWEFTLEQGTVSSHIYINAVTGEEIS